MASNDLSNQPAGNNLENLDDPKSISSGEDVSGHFTGTHEVQECLEGQSELNLHTHLANCKKNPGHKYFTPIKQFNVEHLPPDYRDNDIFNFTKVMADLTVRISVEFTSLMRPKFVSELDTTVPYPCYNTRGQNSLRTGTGMVNYIIKIIEGMENYITCPCPTCEKSKTPSKVWWEVYVVTARHVVFDASEARQTTCRLWFDDDKRPLVKVYGWKVGGSYTERDMCWVHCATHEEDVADKLLEIDYRYSKLYRAIRDKYKINKDDYKLIIIVSHPHGCTKQVSVGHWVHRQVVVMHDNSTRYTYTTSTCPGSSGAQVYRLGRETGFGHPHSGSKCGGLNYSGVYYD